MEIQKIGLGGGCHWCTEAVFSSLKDVIQVEQGFISSKEESTFSEAVIVSYKSSHIALKELIEIHLYTHKSTSNHSMRGKYRSAVYAFNSTDFEESKEILDELNIEFDEELITRVLRFDTFKPSDERFHNYYYTDSNKPFCTTYITPKLSLLLKKYGKFANTKKVEVSISHEEIPK